MFSYELDAATVIDVSTRNTGQHALDFDFQYEYKLKADGSLRFSRSIWARMWFISWWQCRIGLPVHSFPKVYCDGLLHSGFAVPTALGAKAAAQ